MENLNNDFFKQYNEQSFIIPFSVYLNNYYIYNFDYSLTTIESIDNKYLTIHGRMEITSTIGSPQSFLDRYSPKKKEDVVLKYDFGTNSLKFRRNPMGIVIEPALNVSGENNNSWNERILYASDYRRNLLMKI